MLWTRPTLIALASAFVAIALTILSQTPMIVK